MKQIALLAILAIAALPGQAQVGSGKDLYLTKSFANNSFKKIHAATSHGDIAVSVVSGSDAKVEVYIRGRDNHNIPLGKDEIQHVLDEYYKLEIGVSGDELTVAARQKIDFFNMRRSISISFVIYSAGDKSNQLETDHGNLSISGMKGDEQLSTDHGDIVAENIQGNLNLKTDHGNINIAGAGQDIDARTDHGDVTIRQSNGKIRLTTSNGNIKLTDIRGSARADTDHGDVRADQFTGDLVTSTSHGNIDVDRASCSVDASIDHGNLSIEMDKLSGAIVLKNSGGDINLSIPKGNPVNLDLQGKKVVVNSIENFSGTQGNEYIRGTLNGGGFKVSARTDRGQVGLAFR